MTDTAPIPRAAALTALAAVCALLAWAYIVYLQAPAVGTFHDDGVYLVTAKALASGDGYRITSLPGEPAQTKYPILFPWLVSLVWRVFPAFPQNLPWLRLVPFGAGLAWLWLSWQLLRRLGASRPIATMAMTLTAASPWTLFLSTTLLSETVFAALVTGGLWVLLRSEEGSRPIRAAAAGVLLGAAVLTRTAAIAPAAAGLLFLSGKRRWHAALGYGAALLLVSAPWFLWSARHAAEPIVDPFYSATNYASWNIVFNYAWADKLAVLGVNTFWATQFGQYWGLRTGTWPGWIAAAVCTVWVLRGLWIERHSPIALACVSYIGLVLAWAFPPFRFLVPILPLLLWFLFVGAGRLQVIAFALTLALVATATTATWQLARTTQAKGGTFFDAGQIDQWQEIRKLCDWVAANTSPDSVLIATHDPTFFLYTGRKALRPDSMDPLLLYYNVRGRQIDPATDDAAFRERVLRIHADYIIVTPRDATDQFDRLSQRYPGSLTVVAGSLPSHFAIYHVDRVRLSGA